MLYTIINANEKLRNGCQKIKTWIEPRVSIEDRG